MNVFVEKKIKTNFINQFIFNFYETDGQILSKHK